MVAVVDLVREVRMKLFVMGIIMMVVFFCCASLGSVELSGVREIEYEQPKEVVLVSASDVILLSTLVTNPPTFTEDSFDAHISLDAQGFYSLARKIKRLDN